MNLDTKFQMKGFKVEVEKVKVTEKKQILSDLKDFR